MPKGGSKLFLLNYMREVVFGFEDSLVSTLGAISGVAIGSGSTETVVLTGSVLIVVEAISMGAGSYLSSKSSAEIYEERLKQDAVRVLSERVNEEETLHERWKRHGFNKLEIEEMRKAITREREQWLKEVRRHEYRFAPAISEKPVWAALTMTVCYAVGGTMILLPYAVLPMQQGMVVAGLVAVAAMMLLAYSKSVLAGVKFWKSGLEMLLVTAVATGAGVICGLLLQI